MAKTQTEGVAAHVLELCRTQDCDARIVYCGRDEDGRTVLRVRSGTNSSVFSLQKELSTLMPFARVRTSEDVLDGSLQAQIIIPSKHDEFALAYAEASSRVAARALSFLAFANFALGLILWLADNINSGPQVAPVE